MKKEGFVLSDKNAKSTSLAMLDILGDKVVLAEAMLKRPGVPETTKKNFEGTPELFDEVVELAKTEKVDWILIYSMLTKVSHAANKAIKDVEKIKAAAA